LCAGGGHAAAAAAGERVGTGGTAPGVAAASLAFPVAVWSVFGEAGTAFCAVASVFELMSLPSGRLSVLSLM
jgi:hypothetical protein